jgi:multiple sugar transport system substrate-binding protein
MNRRQFLFGVGLSALAASTGLTACGGSSSGGGAGDGSADLAVAWWGNDVRTKNTTAALDAYMKANPAIKITTQPGEFATYWDKLATQTAGNTAPDIIQMDMAYISEYGTRGALLDLAEVGVDTSKFADGTVDAGKIDGKLVGVNAGVNTPVIMANPELFEKAGVKLPDDKTWTWESAMEIGAEITAKTPDGTYGMTAIFNEVLLSAFLRQHGKELFVADGLGFQPADLVPWFDLSLKYQSSKAMPPAAELSEDSNKTLDQGLFGTGKAAMATFWSNQVEALNAASGKTMTILRFPSVAGQATERKAWYKAGCLWSASARTKSPEATGALINWLVNSTDSANINLAERGIPANAEILAAITAKLSPAQKSVAKFIADIKPELATSPVPPPPGGGSIGTVLLRYQLEVLFGRSTPSDAAGKFVDELKANLQS